RNLHDTCLLEPPLHESASSLASNALPLPRLNHRITHFDCARPVRRSFEPSQTHQSPFRSDEDYVPGKEPSFLRIITQLFNGPAQRVFVIQWWRPALHLSLEHDRQLAGAGDFRLNQGQCRRNQLETGCSQDEICSSVASHSSTRNG